MTLLTFIIPVRHPANAFNWEHLKTRLAQTISSISNQSNSNWRAIIVANEGADLPTLPDRFEALRVSFPPNPAHERAEGMTVEEFRNVFRMDKGRRVLSGMLYARNSQFFMIVDDDDLVSCNIVQYVSEHSECGGWKIDHGYIWDDCGKLLMQHNAFNKTCGTSLIISANLYSLPAKFEDASEKWISSMLGSHVQISDILASKGNPLEVFPFRAAIYRVANQGSHSRTGGIVSNHFLNKSVLKHPRLLFANLLKIRLLTDSVRKEFFGK